jgi:hypothetical protein
LPSLRSAPSMGAYTHPEPQLMEER